MALEFMRIGFGVAPLRFAGFLRDIEESVDSKWFHPHPMTFEQAQKICSHRTKDFYYLAVDDGDILAYGMLRGWDKGYATPFLGVFVRPSARGTDLARAFMMFLHAAAKVNGAEKVGLRVHPQNLFAVRLYKSLGYEFSDPGEDGQMIGFVDLKKQGKADPRGKLKLESKGFIGWPKLKG